MPNVIRDESVAAFLLHKSPVQQGGAAMTGPLTGHTPALLAARNSEALRPDATSVQSPVSVVSSSSRRPQAHHGSMGTGACSQVSSFREPTEN